MKISRHYIKYILIVSLFFISNISINAQNGKLMRVEIDAKSGFDDYKLITYNNNGLLLFYRNNKMTNDGFYKWYFSFYDTQLKETWNIEENISARYKIIKTNNDENNLYMLFERLGRSDKLPELIFYILNINTHKFETHQIFTKDKCVITQFEVLDDKLLMAGYKYPGNSKFVLQTLYSFTFVPLFTGSTVVKYQPYIAHYDIKNKQYKVIESSYKSQAYVKEVNKDKKRKVFSVAIKNFVSKNVSILHIVNISTDGTKLSSVPIEIKEFGRKAATAKVSYLSNGSQLAIGTYNNLKGRKANPAFSGFDEDATGIYVSKINNNLVEKINCFNFSELKSFYKSISQRTAMNISKRSMNKKAKGKEYSLEYSIILHDIIDRDSNFILIAETYYPEFRNVTYTNFDMYGYPYTQTYSVFEGYRYTNALILCFDSNGNLLWDNNIEMWDVLSYNLKEKVKALFDEDEILLTYSSNGSIAFKIIQGNKVIENKDKIEIATGNKNDKLIEDYNSDLEYWYDDFFISFGLQHIKNADGRQKNKRTVFYLNKIGLSE